MYLFSQAKKVSVNKAWIDMGNRASLSLTMGSEVGGGCVFGAVHSGHGAQLVREE